MPAWAHRWLVALLGPATGAATPGEMQRKAAERVERALDRLGALDALEVRVDRVGVASQAHARRRAAMRAYALDFGEDEGCTQSPACSTISTTSAALISARVTPVWR